MSVATPVLIGLLLALVAVPIGIANARALGLSGRGERIAGLVAFLLVAALFGAVAFLNALKGS